MVMTIKSTIEWYCLTTLQTYEIDYKTYYYLSFSVFAGSQTFIASMLFYHAETKSVTDGTEGVRISYNNLSLYNIKLLSIEHGCMENPEC